MVNVTEENLPGLLVRPDVAGKQQEAERPPVSTAPLESSEGDAKTTEIAGEADEGPAGTKIRKPKRFHGSVSLDPTRVGRDAGRIADEVISHLVGLMGSKVKVTLEIEAEIQTGAPESVVRTVTENSRTLKFTTQGFEQE